MELKLIQSCLPPNIFKSSAFFTKNSQRCKLHLQRTSWKSQDKKSLVHVVREYETLTSISKLYGVPILEIASAGKDIVDGDLDFEGHHLDVPSPITTYAQVVRLCWLISISKTLTSISKLYGVPILEIASAGKDIVDGDLDFEGHHLDVPSPITTYAQVRHFGGGEWIKNKLSKTSQDLGCRGREWNQIIMKPLHRHLRYAKTTGSFLVLVPLVAFCIRCIMVAIRSRNGRDLRNQEPQMSGGHHRISKSTRWRTALSDLREPDAMDSECEPDSAHVSEDEDQPYINEHSRDHAKVEDEYQKFLSECGMSEWGYWRGGSPK